MLNHESHQNVIISGLTASGKTTHAKILCSEFGFNYFSASTILKECVGLKEDVTNEFWLTSEGQNLRNKMMEFNIDDILIEKESVSKFSIFDCRALPWISNQGSLSIWLESSFESRVMKAIISQGSNIMPLADVLKEISTKDNGDRADFLEAYGFDIYQDLQVFDVIIDISNFISEPTISSSWKSIRQAQDILSLIVGLFLTKDDFYRTKIVNIKNLYGPQIFKSFSNRFEDLL